MNWHDYQRKTVGYIKKTTKKKLLKVAGWLIIIYNLIMIGPGGAETEIFWDNSSDRMTDNTLSPYVASLAAAMRFTMLDKIVLQ